MKKITSLILALAMVLSMSVAVFAADEAETPSNKFETTATVNIPTINVKLPTTAPLFINPLGFSVKISDGTSATGDEEAYQVSKNQIVSPVFQIQNNSPMKLKVSVLGSAIADKATTGFTMTGAPIETEKEVEGVKSPNTANEVFIYAYFDKVTGEGTEATMKDPASFTEAGTKAYALLKSAPASSATPTEVGEIAAAADGEPTILGFKFLGEVNQNAKLDYQNGKSAAVSMTFTFKPVA